MMAAYARWADLNQPEQQAAVFVADCRVSYHPGDWITGRAALTDKLRTAVAGYMRTSHHVSNIEIDFEGPDAATAQSAVIAWHRRHDADVVHPRSLVSPKTMDDFHAGPGADPHANGTIWAAALWDVREHLGRALADGAHRADLLVLQARDISAQ